MFWYGWHVLFLFFFCLFFVLFFILLFFMIRKYQYWSDFLFDLKLAITKLVFIFLFFIFTIIIYILFLIAQSFVRILTAALVPLRSVWGVSVFVCLCGVGKVFNLFSQWHTYNIHAHTRLHCKAGVPAENTQWLILHPLPSINTFQPHSTITHHHGYSNVIIAALEGRSSRWCSRRHLEKNKIK